MKKKALFVFIVLIASLVLALRHFRPDFSWFVEASGDDSTNIADINQLMPEAVMPALGGDWVSTRSFGRKVLLISFWTTWCPGCRDEMPDLIKLQQKFGSQGFTVIAVSVDDQGEESVKTFVQTERFPQFDAWYYAVLSTVSAITTLFFILASPWVVLRGSRSLRRGFAWAAATAFIFNAHWIVIFGSERSELTTGYFLWWCSFLLLAIGLFGLAEGLSPAISG